MNKAVIVYRNLKKLHVSVQQRVLEPPRKMSLDQVIGVLRTGTPPPNDEECAKIVEEERWRKYGRPVHCLIQM